MSAFECDHHNYQGSADQDNSTTPVYDAYDQAGSVAGLVQTLNAGLAHAIQSYLTTGDGEFDESGPLWWRPGWGIQPLPGVVQVVGHSPLEMMRAQRDAEYGGVQVIEA